MAYSTPATQSTDVAIGATTWNVLVDDIKWLAERGVTGAPQCRVNRNNTGAIPDNTITPVGWHGSDWDNAGIHSTSVNASRFTAPVDGVYLMWLQYSWAANSSGIRYASWAYNGTGTVFGEDSKIPVSLFNTAQFCLAVMRLAAGEYAEANAYQNSGGTLQVGTGAWAFFKWISTYT